MLQPGARTEAADLAVSLDRLEIGDETACGEGRMD